MSLFDYLKWSPSLTKLAYNFLYSYLAVKERRANKNELEKIKILKNIHKGKRCFIIGTGPSLQIKDLEDLKNEYTFAPNRIFELFDKTDWRPTFYMCQDHKLIKTFKDRIKTIKAQYCFLPITYKKEFEGRHYRFFVLKEHLYYPGDAQFSKDVSQYLGQGYTVTYGAIQLAIYMGFSEIYLLGVDHNYNLIRDAKGRPVKKSLDKVNYTAGMAELMQDLPRIEESTIAYETAEKVSRKLGAHIYNATRGGKLEAFSRIDFDSIKKK